MDHIQEKRSGVRTEVLIPAKVQEQSGRERLVKVRDLSLEGAKLVCASGSTNLNLKANITITFFEEKLTTETDSNGVDRDKIVLVGTTPIAAEVVRWFKRNPDTSVSTYGVRFSHSIDYSHYIRKIIADSTH